MKTYTLTAEQKRMWIEWKLNPAGRAYNTAFQFEMQGALDLKRFKRAVAQVRGYLDGYRQYFVEKEGEPRQVILSKKEADREIKKRKTPVQFPEIPNFRFIDLTAPGQREADLRAKALEIHEQSIRQRFDLVRDYPLEGYRLIRFGKDQYLFSQVSHHILSDGFSGALSLKLLSLCHNRPWLTRATMGIKTLFTRNKDMGAYLEYVRSAYPGPEQQKDRAYWQATLKNAAFHVDFGLSRRGEGSRGRRLRFNLPEEAVLGISALGQKKSPVKSPVKDRVRKTPFIILAAAFNALLYRYTGQADIVLGYPVNLRPRNRKFNFLSGFMANQVLLRTAVPENIGFGALVERMAGQRQADRLHQQYPYADLIRDLRQEYPSFSPEKINISLGQTAFGTHSLSFRGLNLKPTFLDYGEVMADLTLLYDHDKAAGTLELAFEYRESLFEEDFVRRMQGHFINLILDGLRCPDKPLSRLALLTPDEFRRQWYEWNRTEKRWPRIKPVLQCFEDQVKKTPEALAVIFGKTGGPCLTYAGLNARANQAARYICEKNLKPGGFIGVYMERSLEMVIALYAVIKAGCAYVPLDPELPMDRIEFMAADAGMGLILTQDHLRHNLTSLENRWIILTLDREGLAGYDPSNPDLDLSMDAPVYAIYTSGSTGRPKGVVNIQAGLFNRLMWMQEEYPLQAGDRVLQKTPFAFDVSVWEFFWPLLTGATLVMASPGLHRDPDGLMDCIDEFRITTLHFVPSMLSLFLETTKQEPLRCPSLKQVFSSGEALAPALAGKFFTIFPRAELHNLYGPTEASIDVSFRACTPEDGNLAVLPIGKPIANTKLHILDKNRAPVPAGVTGELYIGGVGLAREYLNRPDLTREKFIADPFGEGRLYQTGDLARYLPDGSIEYLGRIDFQVKIRGFRIELGEIESCILAHPKIREVVVVLKTKDDHSYLSAYLTLADEAPDQKGGEALPDSLDRHLKKKLPSHMVPARFVILDELPLTLNGKVDRKGLMQMEDAGDTGPGAADRASEALGLDPVEQALLQAFCQVLGRQDLGITDDFFRFGGDSLLAVKVAAKLKQAGLALRLTDFFAHPNVAGLAPFIKKAGQGASLTQEQIAAIEIPEQHLRARGLDPAGIEQAYELSLNQSYMVRYYAGGIPDQGFYHFQQAYFLEDTRLNLSLMIRAIQLVTEEHPILRTSFVPDPDRPFQIVRSKIDSPVSVLSFKGDCSALEAFVDGLMKKNRETVPFDPSDPKALLYRITLIPCSKTGLVLLTEFHHSIIDGWSNAEFMKGVFTFYTALQKGENPAPRPPLSGYRDLVALEKSHWRSETSSLFWKNQFQAGFGAPRFPRQNQPNPASFPMAAQRIPGSTGLSLKTRASELQVPVKTLFLSAYLTLLSSPGQKKKNRLTIGIVTNRRSAEMSHPFETVGYLWNLMPFTMDPAKISPDNLGQVHQELQRHEAHGKYPLPLICKDLGIDREDLLFHATFNFIHFHNTGEIQKALYSGLNGLRLTQVKTFNRFHYPLNLLCSQSALDDGFDVFMNYDARCFNGSRTRDLLNRYLSILDTLVRTQKYDA
ncbi:MAG: amino acid adenylation domain-containing protein [Desulfobacteraceae bacterium]|nr:amino acid adenylation domain-containing protein [Desulfobacteraceae bacterium]